MNCWIIWWTGNSKLKISSLIRKIKIKRSYLLEFLFYFWCCVMLLSITILDSNKVCFQNAWMLSRSVKISMYLFHLVHWSIGSISTPPPPPWGIPRTFKLLKIGLFKHPPLPRTKIVFKAQTTVKNSWVAGGDVEAYWHNISRQRVSTWWILVYFEIYVF